VVRGKDAGSAHIHCDMGVTKDAAWRRPARPGDMVLSLGRALGLRGFALALCALFLDLRAVVRDAVGETLLNVLVPRALLR
jgi:hypothetical protein